MCSGEVVNISNLFKKMSDGHHVTEVKNLILGNGRLIIRDLVNLTHISFG